MASSAGYSITIKAVDQTTATLDRINSKIAGAQSAINKRLEAASAPWKRLGTTIGRTVQLLGGGKLARGVQTVSKGFTDLTRASFGAFQNVSRIVDPLGIITGAATIAGLTALEQRFAQLGQTLTNTGALMNMDPAKLAQWENAGKLVGVSSGETDSSLRGLQRSATDARFGMNNQAAGMLQNILGKDWEKQSQDLPGTVMKISAYLQKLKGSARANAIGNIESTFGFSDGFMSELLRGPAALQASLKKAAAHGSPTDAQIGAGDSLAQSINGAQQSLEGLATSITSKLTPVLQPLIDKFSQWVDKNRTLIAQNLGKIVCGYCVRYLKTIDWESMSGKSVLRQCFQARLTQSVQSIGGWQDCSVIGVIANTYRSESSGNRCSICSARQRPLLNLTVGQGRLAPLSRALGAARVCELLAARTGHATGRSGGWGQAQAAATVAWRRCYRRHRWRRDLWTRGRGHRRRARSGLRRLRGP